MIAPISKSCQATCCGLGFTSVKFCANENVAPSTSTEHTMTVLRNSLFVFIFRSDRNKSSAPIHHGKHGQADSPVLQLPFQIQGTEGEKQMHRRRGAAHCRYSLNPSAMLRPKYGTP